MEFADYLACDATALAAHVARGDVRPGELLDLALRPASSRAWECECDRAADGAGGAFAAFFRRA
jgi:hypothetical protein